MKKLLILVLVLVLAFSLASCGKKKNKGKDNDTNSSNSDISSEGGTENGNDDASNNGTSVHTHSLTKTAESKASCTTNGNVEYWSCSGCNKKFTSESATAEITDVTIPASHKLTRVAAKEATCTSSGNIEYWNCSVCSKNFSDSNANTEVTTISTSVLHTLTHYEKNDATCTEDGNIEYWHCEICNKFFSDANKTKEIYRADTVTKASHNYTGGKCTACGQLRYSSGLKYTLSSDNTYYIVSSIGTCTDTTIVIPDTYNELPVTAISDNAFSSRNTITGVIIPESITSIGNNAFKGCYKLIEVYNLSKSITIIAGSEENGYLGYYALDIYTSLSQSSKIFTTEDNFVFYKNGALCLLTNYTGTLKDITLPESFNGSNYEIHTAAFYNNIKITSVVIPDSITSIGSLAFAGCTKIKKATIGSKVSYVGENAFQSCTGLEEVHIKDIPAWCNITFENYESNPLYNAKNLYINDALLTELVIPDTVNEIKAYAFKNCNSITSVTIGENVNSIEKCAFENCYSIEKIQYNATAVRDIPQTNYVFNSIGKNGNGVSVIIGNNVTLLPDYLFYTSSSGYATNIISVEFEEGSTCTSIGDFVFTNCSQLNSIIIPDSVTTIGNSAFYGCSKISSITIGNGVTTINDYAFASCTGATTLTMGSNVTTISNYAFNGCSSISSITIPDSVTLIGYYAFANCIGATSITIGKSVALIQNQAFYNCYSVEKINFNATALGDFESNQNVFCLSAQNPIERDLFIGNNVTKIPAYSFANAYIKSVTFEENSLCESIATYAFYGCKSITDITIGNYVTSIGNFAFSGCTAMETIKFNATAIDDFESNTTCFPTVNDSEGGINVIIGKNVTKIPAYLFNNANLISVKFEDESVCTTIGSGAFYQCKKLRSVTLPSAVTSIGDVAFFYCQKLESIYFAATTLNDFVSNNRVFAYAGFDGNGISVVISKNVTKIPAYCFSSGEYKPKIATVEFEEKSVFRSIGKNAFYDVTSITSISLPNSTTSIGDYAFYSCSNLQTIVIPESVTTIGIYAFYNCRNLSGAIDTKSVTTIGKGAFKNCSSITSITLSSSITLLGDEVFYGCSKVEEIYYNLPSYPDFSYSNKLFYDVGHNGNGIKLLIGKDVTKIPAQLFASSSAVVTTEAPKIVNVEFESGSVCNTIGNSAFFGCYALVSVKLPNGLITIGNTAFGDCTSLVNVSIPDSVTSIGTAAFNNCKSLTTIKIPDGITLIDNYAFSNCTNLANIVIPKSVQTMGYYAFSGCTGITAVYYSGTAADWGSISFSSSENNYIKNATRYYYSEDKPASDGNYWHYDENGEAKIWA